MLFCWIAILLFAKAGNPVSLMLAKAFDIVGISSGVLVGDIVRQTCSFLSVIAIVVWCRYIKIHHNSKKENIDA